MKKTALLLIVLVLTGCSTFSKKDDLGGAAPHVAAPRLATQQTAEEHGPLKMVFDVAGNWISVTSTESASIGDGSDNSRFVAEKTAEMLAKQHLAALVKTDTKAKTVIRNISKTSAKNIDKMSKQRTASSQAEMIDDDGNPVVDGGTEVGDGQSEQATRMSSILMNTVTTNSEALLRGAHVSKRSIRDGRAYVSVTVLNRKLVGFAQ